MQPKNPQEAYEQHTDMSLDEEAKSISEDEISITSEGPQTQPEEKEQACRELVCPTCTVKAEAEESRLRALAEMENFKKRLNREHEEQLRYAAEKVLADLLPTLDNLDLALQYGSRQEACKDMLLGVEMTRKLLLEALQKHGLEAVGAVGETFTPELHEALSFDIREDMEPGLVSGVPQRGYKLKERLLRPAKVTISKLP